MASIAQKTFQLLDRSLGRCTKCMRTAFQSALAALLATGLAYALGFTISFWLCLGTALGLVLLWSAHVGFFAARQSFALKPGLKSVPVLTRSGGVAPIQLSARGVGLKSRRQVITLFARSAAFAAVASAMIPKKANAACGDCGAGWHDCITNYCGTLGQICCPQGYPYLNHCDCKCYDTNGFDCNSYSNCLYCG